MCGHVRSGVCTARTERFVHRREKYASCLHDHGNDEGSLKDVV